MVVAGFCSGVVNHMLRASLRSSALHENCTDVSETNMSSALSALPLACRLGISYASSVGRSQTIASTSFKSARLQAIGFSRSQLAQREERNGVRVFRGGRRFTRRSIKRVSSKVYVFYRTLL